MTAHSVTCILSYVAHEMLKDTVFFLNSITNTISLSLRLSLLGISFKLCVYVVSVSVCVLVRCVSGLIKRKIERSQV